jgi:hypothetical protein
LLALATGLHPESQSHSRVVVDGARVEVELRFQSLSLIEFHPELDRSRDGVLDEGELAAGREAIAAYLLGGYRLFRPTDGGEEPLRDELVSLVPQDPARLGAFELQELTAKLRYDAPAPLESLLIEARLFFETNPWHRDFCTLVWNGAEPRTHVFTFTNSRRLFPDRARRSGVLASFVGLGLTHVLGAPARLLGGADHLAFLLALLLVARRLRALLGVVTAFTLAHALTLSAAAAGWVDVPERFVELAVALAIAYVACDNLLRPSARDPWLEAMLFGLLHGLGFKGFLSDELAGEALVPTAVLGFHLGLELGQLAFVLAVGLGLVLLQRARPADPVAGLAPPRLRRWGSLAVAAAGFYWFGARAGWLPAF